jgi:hypothetical protein
LAAGVILAFISSNLHPGNTLINPVDQTDFPQAVSAIGDAANLSHLMTLLAILSMLLMSFGVLGLYPLTARQGGLGSAILRFGIFASILEWSCIVVGMGLRLFVTHLTQRAADAPDGSELQALFETNALAMHTTSVAVLLAFVALFPLASMSVGIGTASRMQTMNVFKIASYGLFLFGAAGLVNFLIALFAGADAPNTYFAINSVFLSLSAICLLAVGVGMYQGRGGLAEEGSSG